MSGMIKSEDLVRALRDNKFIEMDASAFECICDIIESFPFAEPDPIYMESIQAEAYNRGIDSERKRIAESWCKAEYERGYKDGQESAGRKGRNLLAEYPSLFECSECGTSCHDTIPWDCNINYCPNCGARMKGADDE